MLDAATEQLATIAGQQPSVRRARKSIAALQAARGHAGRRRRDAARRARLRVPRPADVDRDPADPRLPRAQPALVRRPRQLLDGRARADHLPRDRLRRDRPGARARRHDHDDRAAPTRRRSRCSRRSACRSPRRAAPAQRRGRRGGRGGRGGAPAREAGAPRPRPSRPRSSSSRRRTPRPTPSRRARRGRGGRRGRGRRLPTTTDRTRS